MKITAALALLVATVLPVAAQSAPTWDVSGNHLLSGTYYFRYVAYVTDYYYYGDGTLNEEASAYGTVTFDGNGGYAINGNVVDYTGFGGVSPQTFSVNGSFTISASGLGFLDNPVSTGSTVYGLVSDGIFIGSSTEAGSGFNDLFIAIPAGSSPATNASFQGAYQVGHLNLPDFYMADARDAMFQLNPDGNGAITGTVTATGYIGATGSTEYTQSNSGVSYSFTNGVGTLVFPASQQLISGSKEFYISADGKYILGGSTTGFDMLFGASTTGDSNPAVSGLYYQAGIDLNVAPAIAGYNYEILDSYYGAWNVFGQQALGHKRTNSAMYSTPYDYTFGAEYMTNLDGTLEDTQQTIRYGVAGGGSVGIGMGLGPYMGLSVALKAPEFTASGVYINPTAVVNAASSAPFTNSLSRGEMVTIYGSNLSSGDPVVAGALPFPTTLNDVQVNVNGRMAPIYYVSPTQISFLIPYATEQTIAGIQVVNNGVASNTVTLYMSATSPGVFTIPAGGLGYAAARHLDGSVVTADNPAQVNEYISVYVAGLGDVNPAIQDGSAGPTDPLSYTTNQIDVYVGNTLATTNFVGIAPYFGGLYQINVLIPSGTQSGDVVLDLEGPESSNLEALIPIGSGPGVSSGSPATQTTVHPKQLRRNTASQ